MNDGLFKGARTACSFPWVLSGLSFPLVPSPGQNINLSNTLAYNHIPVKTITFSSVYQYFVFSAN